MIDARKYKREIQEISKHSTTVVADALEKFGSVPGLLLIHGSMENTHIAGPVYYVETYFESNWHVHRALEDTPEGAIVFVEPILCDERAIFGKIVTEFIMSHRKAKGIIVNGYMRDIDSILPTKYPIWYKGNNPVGCLNKEVEKPDHSRIQIALKEKRAHYDHPENSICVADAVGVVIVPEEKILSAYLRVQEIASLEIIWNACIDTGLSTFETVCIKVYEEKTIEDRKKMAGPKYAVIRELYAQHQSLMNRLTPLRKNS